MQLEPEETETVTVERETRRTGSGSGKRALSSSASQTTKKSRLASSPTVPNSTSAPAVMRPRAAAVQVILIKKNVDLICLSKGKQMNS